jgi:predicted RNA-binding Zn ribbon-like protein
MATDSAAPDGLELVRRFVNTNDVEEGKDEIATPKSLRAWVKDNGLPVGRIGDADVKRAIAAREGLRGLLLANNGEPLDPAAVEALNRTAPSVSVRFDAEGGSALAAERTGIDLALAPIFDAVFCAMTEGTWKRLKACREDRCQWVFYDRSKNRSATWCSMEVCGNRNKARTFRERHKN